MAASAGVFSINQMPSNSPEGSFADRVQLQIVANRNPEDAVDVVAAIFEDREREMPPAGRARARRKLNAIATACRTPRARRRR